MLPPNDDEEIAYTKLAHIEQQAGKAAVDMGEKRRATRVTLAD